MKRSKDAETLIRNKIKAYQVLLNKHNGKTFICDTNSIKVKLVKLRNELSSYNQVMKKTDKEIKMLTYNDSVLKSHIGKQQDIPTIWDNILLYTDGACLSNPNGKGGYGLVVLKEVNQEILFEESGSTQSSTNNRMELIGFLRALQYLTNNNFQFATIKSDSEYVVNALNKGWIHKWHKDKYKKRYNADLWQQIYPLYIKYFKSIKIEWVKAHNGEKFNEIVDKLAYNAAKNH